MRAPGALLITAPAAPARPRPACRCRQLQELLPPWLPGRWLSVFTQQWEGDVTIALPHAFAQLWKAVVNPSNAGAPAVQYSLRMGLPGNVPAH